MRKLSLPFLLFFFVYSIVFGEEKKFTILHTSDEHSTLSPIPLTDYKKDQSNSTLGGFARWATKVKEIRAQKGDEPVLLLSSGDIMGGSPFAWLILEKKSHEIEIMQKIGYQAMTIGNHEFDYGPNILAEYLARAGYADGQPELSIIISNLNIPDTLALKKINLLPSKIYTLGNGVKIGIFGIQGKSAFSLAPAAGDVTIFDQYEIGNKTVEALKKQGADVIVMLSHSGIDEDKIMAKKIKGIDIILGGHDHINTPQPLKVNNTIIFHPDYYLRHFGQLEFAYNTETKKTQLINERNGTEALQPLNSDIPEDSTIAAIIQTATDELNAFLTTYTNGRFNFIDSTVIESNFDVVKEEEYKETTIGNFVADAMRLEGSKIIGDRIDIAIQGNGVIRGDILTGKLDSTKGKFSLFDMLTLTGLGAGPDQSAGYPMVSCYLTEKEIFNVLEVTAMMSQVYGDNFFLQVSGLKYTYDPGKSLWGKIPFLGTPIPATMAVKSVFLYTGNGLQDDSENYIKLQRDGDRLFHVVTDYYLAKFLPMVGEVLPKLEISFKDKNRNKKTLDECVVHQEDGKEFKVWQALSMYAQELKQMPTIYKETQKRITKEEGIPLKVWTITGLIVLLLLIIIGGRKFKNRKKKV
ncbi:MAG TPA: bifunctional metallophosphatase/5'-nucleotidase [Chitinophagales bacterium]|nr:bifunctional metallophosphatase/5'-nucleotidase [Chitinophagales bacterium]